ncbi:SLBB domain-containing protein [Massilia sp. LC238]|uniref:polysaccharide biosynthesis/export family protein n=1 Tax=Massilia sp. LC238 TaxID=1502852 RepID=UPI0004E2BA37|nr:SLBB domain-containing protein [Massilia sp. LC238]KFC69477.1 Capsule polysaccharide export protein [Massilia sp. LC238]
MFGQNIPDPAATAAVPASPTTPRRVSITNRNAGATAAGSRAGGATAPRRPGSPDAALGAFPGAAPKASWGEGQQEEDVKVLTEFQKFIFDSVGEELPTFGSSFFANAPSTFAPILNSPVPSEYVLGPGDELLIRGWGTIDIDFRATIDRNGTITIPTIGSVVLAGVKAGDADDIIRSAVAKLYKGVTVNVNFGQLRAITIYVVGQAKRPGTYTVSSLSTLVTALFASGGPNANGSMRRVQVKRAGRVVAELDLYAFIAKGDKSADVKLLDGDSIYIPAATGYIALVGKVNSPAIYELKTGGDTIESMLDFAGGMPVVADPRRAFLERIDPSKSRPRSVEQFALDSASLKRSLKDGDVLNITSITPEFSNAVILRGNVDQPVRAPFKAGMRISDLIPSRDYLITRASVKRQNQVIATGQDEQVTNEHVDTIAASVGNLVDEVNWDYAVVERINRKDLSVTLVPFNLGNVFANPAGADNIELQPGDTVTVFSQQDVAVPMNKRRVLVRIEGEVKVPGVYQMGADDTLQTLLAKAGGPTANAYLFGTAFHRDTVRKEQEINLEKAARRLEAQLTKEQSQAVANQQALASVNPQVIAAQQQAQAELARQKILQFRQLKPTGRIAFNLDPKERSFARLPQVKLENGDRVVVPATPAFVHVIGAVNVESSVLWKPNERVKDYLKVAGVTSDADVDETFVIRADGSVISRESGNWLFGSIGGLEVMPGDSVVIPEKFDRETKWTKFMRGTREWAQIFSSFGLGAAAIKTLRD